MALIRNLLFCGALSGALGLAACTSSSGGQSRASDESPVTIVRLWTAYRDAQSFTRLGQLPKTDEEPGEAIVLRSQPESRDGFYFTVRLRATGDTTPTIPDGTVTLRVVAPDAAEARTFEFPLATNGQRSVQLLLGLTGADWTHGETMPLAWKLEISDSAGQVVGGQESFLWRKP